MAWRVARSLDVLLGQINKAYPKRSTVSDGSIGDADHASRSSDHNPWVKFPGSSTGIVTARDFTHDPANGFDAHKFAEHLRQTRDPRIKYVISYRKIFAGNDGPSPWTWRTYTGTNPHIKHIHVSVRPYPSSDSTTPWRMPTTSLAAPIRPEDDMSAADVLEIKQYIDTVANALRANVRGDVEARIDEVANALRANLRDDIDSRTKPIAERVAAIDAELDQVRKQNDAIGSNTALQRTLLEVKQKVEE